MIIKLDRRIEIQAATDTISASGGFAQTWTTLATVWAKFDSSSAVHERQESTKETAITRPVFTIRYNADYLNKKNRIKYDNKLYDILSILEEGRKKYLKIVVQINE